MQSEFSKVINSFAHIQIFTFFCIHAAVVVGSNNVPCCYSGGESFNKKINNLWVTLSTYSCTHRMQLLLFMQIFFLLIKILLKQK